MLKAWLLYALSERFVSGCKKWWERAPVSSDQESLQVLYFSRLTLVTRVHESRLPHKGMMAGNKQQSSLAARWLQRISRQFHSTVAPLLTPEAISPSAKDWMCPPKRDLEGGRLPAVEDEPGILWGCLGRLL
jgi:hypothetical protein